MKRNIDINAISDGNVYTSSDLVKVSCNDCMGCDKCCKDMGESIILDPYDIYQITTKINKSFEELLKMEIALSVVDGVILPHINMTDSNPKCSFLVNGRCSIHSFRPGICRLFPLARVYNEDGTFNYINQIYECDHDNKSKIKIKKWLDIPAISEYEKYITRWHNLLKKIESKASDDNLLKRYNMQLLQVMFVTPYSCDDFYKQFEERMKLIDLQEA